MPFLIRFSSEDWKAAFSSRLEPFVIGTFAAAHIVSSLRYFWNELKKRRQEKAQLQAIASSLYWKVVSGGCHHGWKMVLPGKMMAVQRIQPRYWTLRVGFASDEKNNGTRLDRVVAMVMDSPSPDGQRVYTMRMWSLVCPKVNAILLRILCRHEDWPVHYASYLDDSTYGLLFRRTGTTRYRLVICSTCRQGRLKTRKYDLQSPIKNATVGLVHFGSTKSQLFVLFSRCTWDDFEDDEQNAEDHDAGSQVLEYILASYDLPAADEPDNTIHYPRSYEGISIPTRNRYQFHGCYPVLGEQIIFFVYNEQDTTDYVPPLCITYKANRGWTVDTVSVWAQKLRNERDGTDLSTWKLLKVMRSFRRLDPPESRCWTKRLPVVGKCVFGNRHGDDIFAFTRDGVFRRRVNPPSLKHLAAEALFRSNPTLTRLARSELKREIGINVFEGIPEEKEEREIPMIHL